MKNIIYIVSILLFCCFSCEQKATTYAALEKANWFLGKWENKTTEGTFSEEWKVENWKRFIFNFSFSTFDDSRFS